MAATSSVVLDVTDLGGIAELSADLGVPKQTVSNWAHKRARPRFPEPLLRLKATPVWSRSAVRSWYDSEMSKS